MKAYQFDYDDWNGYSTIIYAETRNKAKVEAVDYANTYSDGIEYKDVRLKRVSWADKYGDFDNIPKKILLEHCWWFECERCGEPVYEDECAEDRLPLIICNHCAEETNE